MGGGSGGGLSGITADCDIRPPLGSSPYLVGTLLCCLRRPHLPYVRAVEVASFRGSSFVVGVVVVLAHIA